MKELVMILDKCSNGELSKWHDESNYLWQDACEEFADLDNASRKELFALFKTKNNIWQHLFLETIALCCEFKINNYKLDKRTANFIKNLKIEDIKCGNVTGIREEDLYNTMNIIFSHITDEFA